jgi:DNA-binding winged helix-turn-helix (wHTH) protein/tetratricopeptide (TPR) repeat protein
MDQQVAHPRYRFGDFELDPADMRLAGPAGPIRVGHKALRVLETLILGQGRLVTKDELFETVWDGTIVSESALTSVIKELRRALGEESKRPRFIESVYGQGYRFIAPAEVLSVPGPGRPPEAKATLALPQQSRRTVLGGAVAAAGLAAVVGGGAFAYRRNRESRLPSEAAQLIDRAREMMDQGTYEGQNQAIGLSRRAVELAPKSAQAWGWLSVAYAVPSHYRSEPERSTLRARAEAAGRQSLAIESRNGIGELGLALIPPIMGAWQERDRLLARAMADKPDDPDVLTFRAVTLIFVGRMREALSYYDRVPRRPFSPAVYSNYNHALWSAGRMEELDQALNDAGKLYPSQANIWFDRYNMWLLGGRIDDAVALATNRRERASAVDERLLDELLAQAQLVRDPRGPGATAVVDRMVKDARISPSKATVAIHYLSAAGYLDEVFAIANAYYFGRGYVIPDSPRDGTKSFVKEERQTRFLFDPATTKMRADPRFERLVEEIGLDRYWRESGHQPDYRRFPAV